MSEQREHMDEIDGLIARLREWENADSHRAGLRAVCQEAAAMLAMLQRKPVIVDDDPNMESLLARLQHGSTFPVEDAIEAREEIIALIAERATLRDEAARLMRERDESQSVLAGAGSHIRVAETAGVAMAGQINDYRAQLEAAQADARRAHELHGQAQALHHELLYAVAHKYPSETRHETALRYIREREQEPHRDARAAIAATPAGEQK